MKLLNDLTIFATTAVGSLTVQIVGVVLGLFIVPIMLLLGRWDRSTTTPFTVGGGKNSSHTKQVFPRIFWPWDNLEDSSMGDIRGWWDRNCYKQDATLFVNRFWWMAVRNPFNNFKRYVLGCDIREYDIEKLFGDDYVRDDLKNHGCMLLKASPSPFSKKVVPRYHFYLVWPWKHVVGGSTRAVVIQIGNKIHLSHDVDTEEDVYDYWKGWTFEINPWKDIG